MSLEIIKKHGDQDAVVKANAKKFDESKDGRVADDREYNSRQEQEKPEIGINKNNEANVNATWKRVHTSLESIAEKISDETERNAYKKTLKDFGEHIKDYFSLIDTPSDKSIKAYELVAKLTEAMPAEKDLIVHTYKREGEKLLQILEVLAQRQDEENTRLAEYVMNKVQGTFTQDADTLALARIATMMQLDEDTTNRVTTSVSRLKENLDIPFSSYAESFLNAEKGLNNKESANDRAEKISEIVATKKKATDDAFHEMVSLVETFRQQTTAADFTHETRVDITGERLDKWQEQAKDAFKRKEENKFLTVNPRGATERTILGVEAGGNKPDYDIYDRTEEVRLIKNGQSSVHKVSVPRLIVTATVYKKDLWESNSPYGESSMFKDAYKTTKLPVEQLRMSSLAKCMAELEDLNAAFVQVIDGKEYYIVPKRDAQGNLNRGMALPTSTYYKWKTSVEDAKEDFVNAGFREDVITGEKITTLADTLKANENSWLEMSRAEIAINKALGTVEDALEDSEESKLKKNRLRQSLTNISKMAQIEVDGRYTEYRQIAIQRLMARFPTNGPGKAGWQEFLETHLAQEVQIVAAEMSFEIYAIKEVSAELQIRQRNMELCTKDPNIEDDKRNEVYAKNKKLLEEFALNADYEIEIRVAALKLVGTTMKNGEEIVDYKRAEEVVRKAFEPLMANSEKDIENQKKLEAALNKIPETLAKGLSIRDLFEESCIELFEQYPSTVTKNNEDLAKQYGEAYEGYISLRTRELTNLNGLYTPDDTLEDEILRDLLGRSVTAEEIDKFTLIPTIKLIGTETSKLETYIAGVAEKCVTAGVDEPELEKQERLLKLRDFIDTLGVV